MLPPNDFNSLPISAILKFFVSMRKVLKTLNTIVCGLACAVFMGLSALAQDVHPEIGLKTSGEFTNKELSELPARERQAWVHGAMLLLIQATATKDTRTARCVQDWYFDIGNGQTLIPTAMAQYPDQYASVTIVAVARLACPDL